MRILKYTTIFGAIAISLLLTLTSCGGKYQKIDGKIYWTYHTFSFGKVSEPLDADTLTFVDLDHNYGKDKNHAFYQDSMMTGVHVPTFESIKDDYAKDCKHAFYTVDMIKGADVNTFKVKNTHVSKDDHDYYWKSTPFHVYDMDKFKIFYVYDDEADWARDSKYGYYINPDNSVVKFPIADYKEFEPITYKDSDGIKLTSCDYATDGVHIYYCGKIVRGVDLETFKVLAFHWGQDKKTYYYMGAPTDSIPDLK